MEFLEISSYFAADRILNFAYAEKQEVLDALIDAIVKENPKLERDGIRKAIYDRESETSTAIGDGVALPHARTPLVEDITLAFARVEEGVAWGASEKAPIKLVFMILANDKQDRKYIKILSRLMLLLKQKGKVKRLLEEDDPATLFDILKEN